MYDLQLIRTPISKQIVFIFPIFKSYLVWLVGAPGGSEHSVVTAMTSTLNALDRFSIFGNMRENQLYHLYLGPTEIQSRSALYQLRYRAK